MKKNDTVAFVSPFTRRMNEIIAADKKRGLSHMHLFHSDALLATAEDMASEFVLLHDGADGCPVLDASAIRC